MSSILSDATTIRATVAVIGDCCVVPLCHLPVGRDVVDGNESEMNSNLDGDSKGKLTDYGNSMPPLTLIGS